MSIRINLAREADCEAIADMSRDYVEYGLPWSWTAMRIGRCVRNRECAVIAAREGRRCVGFAIMEFHDVHAHLSLLAIHPGYRRRGIARELVEWLEASSRIAGIFLVRLELRSDNAGAREFYERLGYERTGTTRNYYAGREDALRMERDLSILSQAGESSL